MFIIETVGGMLLGASAIGFFAVAAFDRPLQNWLRADRNLNDGAGSENLPVARPKRASAILPAAHAAQHNHRRDPKPLKKAA
jgi:hypothetical protein